MNFDAIFEGIKLGVLLSLMIGPVFFALMTTSLEHGFRQAAFLAFGVFISDLFYVLCTFIGIQFLYKIPGLQNYLGVSGGVILIGFGIYFIAKWEQVPAKENLVSKPKIRKAIFQGLGINGINPFVMLFWLSIASMVSLKSTWVLSDRALFYMALLFTVFGIDLAKAFLAGRLAHMISTRVRKVIQVGAGLLICYFGIKMLVASLSSGITG